MKTIKHSKRYDTETATEIAEWSSPHFCNDFQYVNEVLHQTKSGNWFIAGEGGAMTRYASECPDGHMSGSEIVPLTEDEAYEWLELHDFTELLETHFGDRITDA